MIHYRALIFCCGILTSMAHASPPCQNNTPWKSPLVNNPALFTSLAPPFMVHNISWSDANGHGDIDPREAEPGLVQWAQIKDSGPDNGTWVRASFWRSALTIQTACYHTESYSLRFYNIATTARVHAAQNYLSHADDHTAFDFSQVEPLVKKVLELLRKTPTGGAPFRSVATALTQENHAALNLNSDMIFPPCAGGPDYSCDVRQYGYGQYQVAPGDQPYIEVNWTHSYQVQR